MSEELRTLVLEHPEWVCVLAAYAAAEETVPASTAPAVSDTEPDGAGRGLKWSTRLTSIAGVPNERLAPLHGRLIAHGLLQFNLGGRDSGVLYRITGEARRLVEEIAGSTELQTSAAEEAASSRPRSESLAA
jgi:hypothetical protein